MTTGMQSAGGGGGGGFARPNASGLADVLDTILDKGLVIDAYVRVSLVGIELITIDARVVVASVDTYLRFAEAVNRLDISQEKEGLPGLVGNLEQNGAKNKTKGALAQLADLLRALNITWSPIAKGTCDHRHREERYKPSRKLGHLVRARTATCPAPGCGASAYHADLDHTVPWPKGPSDECNISPPCRHHHRVKQAPGWKLEQISPGVMRWTAPSGRTYTTTPTTYDL